MATRPPRKTKSSGTKLGLFLLLNILPLLALAWLGIQWWRGAIVIRDLPAGFSEGLIVLGAVFVALLLATSGLSVAHARLKDANSARRRSLRVLRSEIEGSKPKAFLLSVLWGAIGAFAWLARALFIPLCLALIAVVLVLLVRLFEPTFAEPLVQSVRDFLQRRL